MTHTKPITFQEHQRRAAKALQAKRSPEERRQHALMMVQAREAKRAAKKAKEAPNAAA